MSITLINDLYSMVLFSLEVSNPKGKNGWDEERKKADGLNLQGDKEKEWTHYVNLLNHSAINLPSHKVSIKWSKNKGSQEHTTKLGYSTKKRIYINI